MTEENSEQNPNQDLDFLEQAKNLVEKIGATLGGKNAIRDFKALKGKNLAMIVLGADSNSSHRLFYHYDAAYLIWKDKNNQLKNKIIVDSKGSKDYIYINEIIEDEKYVFIKLNYSDPAWKEKMEKREVFHEERKDATYRLKKEDYFGNEKNENIK